MVAVAVAVVKLCIMAKILLQFLSTRVRTIVQKTDSPIVSVKTIG